MQEVPNLQPALGLNLSVGAIALLVLMVLMSLAALGAWKFWQNPFRWDSAFPFLREICWLGLPVVVAVVFGGISMQDQPPPWASNQQSSIASVQKPLRPPFASDSKTVAVPVSRQTTEKIDEVVRPSWISHSNESGLTVLSSGQYATREEAESELMSKMSDMVIQSVRQASLSGNWTGSWRPSDWDIWRYAFKQEYTEATETDFGSFQHPMYRVWWQVDLSDVRGQFLPAWRHDAVTSRIRLLGALATSIALAASLIRMYFGLDTLTKGRYRLALKGLTAGCAAGWLFLVRFVGEGRLW